jgi:hypothetical protein
MRSRRSARRCRSSGGSELSGCSSCVRWSASRRSAATLVLVSATLGQSRGRHADSSGVAGRAVGQTQCSVGVEHAGDVLAGVDRRVVAVQDPPQTHRVGHDCPGERRGEPVEAARGLGGGRAGQVRVVVIGGQVQQHFAAGEGLLGFDLGAEAGVRGADILCPTFAKDIDAALKGLATKSNDTYEVGRGPGKIAPGKWKAARAASDCYWERTSAAGDIIDNKFATHATTLIVTVGQGDGSVTFQGCPKMQFVK